MHVHQEFSASLEKLKLKGNDFSMTRSRFQIFRGRKTSIERGEERVYAPPISQGATTELAMIKIINRAIHCISIRILTLLDNLIVFGTS